MDQTERQIIDELFGKIRRVETESPPRDAGAEAVIREHVAAQPAAPYYMAQAIVVQEQALAASHARVQQLERQLSERQGGGGFLSGLFGGGQEAERPEREAPAAARPALGRRHIPQAGGGFLAGAMQTALGVAGGVMIANAITSAFAPGDAAAGEAAAADVPPDDADFGGDETGGLEDFGGPEDFGGF